MHQRGEGRASHTCGTSARPEPIVVRPRTPGTGGPTVYTGFAWPGRRQRGLEHASAQNTIAKSANDATKHRSHQLAAPVFCPPQGRGTGQDMRGRATETSGDGKGYTFTRAPLRP